MGAASKGGPAPPRPDVNAAHSPVRANPGRAIFVARPGRQAVVIHTADKDMLPAGRMRRHPRERRPEGRRTNRIRGRRACARGA
ncbi:hypothetical protein CNY67_13520 [Desulfovibrio sp. G11]|nr:hypothetical protein CNY67_13520 [Desulfovibrio sp. G11]